MELLGFTVTQLSAVCHGQAAGLTVLGGEHVIALGLHNASDDAPAQGMKLDAFTVVSPERARELAMVLWNLADEVGERNAAAQTAKEDAL